MTVAILDPSGRKAWFASPDLYWCGAKSLVLVSTASMAWSSGHLWLLPLSLLLPLLLSTVTGGGSSLLLAASYFAGALWPLLPGARVFFGEHLDPVKILLLYLAWVLALAGPFYGSNRFPKIGRSRVILAILLLEALTPLGLASPLVTAGCLFPGWGWMGLLLSLYLCESLARRCLVSMGSLVLLSVSVWMFASPAKPLSASIQAINTRWGGRGFDHSNLWGDYETMQEIAAHAHTGRITIFPENAIQLWVPGISDGWFSPLLPPQSTVIFGTEYAIENHGRQPVVLVRGSVQADYHERFPVPVAMWGNDTPLHYFGSGSIRIGHLRAGILLCYEQLLPIAALETMREHPDLLIAPANLYWARNTTITQSEELCVRAWAQLFHIPYYRAVNQ